MNEEQPDKLDTNLLLTTDNTCRRTTDWESKLADDERNTNDDGKPVVYLRGLQRLAEEANIQRSWCDIQNPSPKMIQCIYHAEFGDGTEWVGTADCTPGNTKEPYISFATAVAESRAEARCLRKALGIRILSSEEIGMTESFGTLESSPEKTISSEFIKNIEVLCQSRGADAVDAIEAVLSTERAGNIHELKHLTTVEGMQIISWLNDQPLAKKQDAATQRDARKKELEKELNNEN